MMGSGNQSTYGIVVKNVGFGPKMLRLLLRLCHSELCDLGRYLTALPIFPFCTVGIAVVSTS